MSNLDHTDFEAKIITNSISPHGHQLTTFEITFPRFILAEFNTHRMFSRNSASSRAIPVHITLKRVGEHPFVPIYWGRNQSGMQAAAELDQDSANLAAAAWRNLRFDAMRTVAELQELDVHKQTANRLLEPWMWHTVIVSATDLGNFRHLRTDKNAQPEMQKIANMMFELFDASKPTKLGHGQWHLPYFREEDIPELMDGGEPDMDLAVKVTCGRCARVSYLTHDGTRLLQKDIELHDNLLGNGHMSPLEHAARPMTDHEYHNLFAQKKLIWLNREWKWVGAEHGKEGQYTHYCGNFEGFVQHRKMIPHEEDALNPQWRMP